jgi:hypothetical protein
MYDAGCAMYVVAPCAIENDDPTLPLPPFIMGSSRRADVVAAAVVAAVVVSV